MNGTILVVEDRLNCRTTFRELFEFEGLRVIEATCAAEFKDKAVDADVILLDIAMPIHRVGPEDNTAGLDALLELRKAHPKHLAIHKPIIRSMWNRELFGSRYQVLIDSIPEMRWRSRDTPLVELLALVKTTLTDIKGSTV